MKTWDKKSVRWKIQKSRAFLQKVIVMVYENGQTKGEKKTKTATRKNRVGFTFAQATRGTWYAEAILKGETLKGDDLEKGLKIALVYGQQAAEILNQSQRYVHLDKAFNRKLRRRRAARQEKKAA